MAYSTKSSCDTLRKSVIGKTDWKTACKPASSRSLGKGSICRKRSYERFCTSMRLGIWMVAGILEKSKRFRLAVFCCAMYKAPDQWQRRYAATQTQRGCVTERAAAAQKASSVFVCLS